MSNDDLRWSPPDGTQPLPSGESGDETAGHMGFAPLPDLAPLPDIEELLRFAPPTSDDEAVAGQAETDASPTAPGPAIQAPASSPAENAGEHESITHGHAPEPHEDSGESVTP